MLIAHRRRLVGLLAVALIVAQVFALGLGGRSFFGANDARAEAPADPAFERTWARTDQPVASGQVQRTWVWGPEASSGPLIERYEDAPGGWRVVQYFDKSRMELNLDPALSEDSPWRVTNGLLVLEMISGRLQVGDDDFIAGLPAQIEIAGDPNDTTGPTYATLGPLLGAPAVADGAPVVQRLARSGSVSSDPSLATYGVTAAQHVQQDSIDHQVASVFWDFMNSTGLVYRNGQYVEDALFLNPFYATGLPITEAYWTTVKVGGIPSDVLLQCFERRCLTYTPSNDDGWKVEAGNVGLHYYAWRSSWPGQAPTPAPTEPAPTEPGPPSQPTQPGQPELPTKTPTPNPTATATATSTRTVPPTATPTTPAPPPPTATKTPTATATSGGGQSEAACLNSTEAEVLRLLNVERQKRGLAPFTNSRKLNTASYYHSLDMATNNFFSHTGSNGSSFSQRINAAGYTGWTAAAENIAAGYSTASAVVNGWMNSEGHRRNILNASLTQIGIGLVQTGSGYKFYWTTDFGNASDSGC